MATRTHTVYFNDETLDDLDKAIDALAEDIDHRRPHVSSDVGAAVDHRISLLRSARALLAEPVPDAMY